MRNRIRFGSAMVMSVVLSVLAWNVNADQQDDYNNREQNGAANAIWMRGLIDDYDRGTLTEADLLRQLWVERPVIMNALYGYHGAFNHCFRIDLIAAETNGVKSESGGVRVFYDESVYLDGTGNVISGSERAYNNAVRANAILNDAYTYFLAYCPGCPANNLCCSEVGNTTNCDTIFNGRRCCNTGPDVPNCTQTQGNPCN